MRIVILAMLFAAFSLSTSFAGDGEKTQAQEKKVNKVEKADCSKECCADADLGHKKNTKDVRVMKEKGDDGNVVTKVTIKTVNDGKVEEKTLQGEEAQKYADSMKEEMSKEEENIDVDGKVVKKIIKREIKKTEKE